MKENLLKIINNYGIRNQLKKLSEEVYELQEAVLDYETEKRLNNMMIAEADDKSNMESETADVLNLVNQVIEYYNLDRDRILNFREFKNKRQLERMKNE